MIRPIGDRVVAKELPIESETASPILNAYGEKQDSQNTGVRLEVVAVSLQVESNGDINVGDVIIIGARKLLNIMRTRLVEDVECYVLHESDVDGLELQGD